MPSTFSRYDLLASFYTKLMEQDLDDEAILAKVERLERLLDRSHPGWFCPHRLRSFRLSYTTFLIGSSVGQTETSPAPPVFYSTPFPSSSSVPRSRLFQAAPATPASMLSHSVPGPILGLPEVVSGQCEHRLLDL